MICIKWQKCKLANIQPRVGSFFLCFQTLVCQECFRHSRDRVFCPRGEVGGNEIIMEMLIRVLVIRCGTVLKLLLDNGFFFCTLIYL